MIRAIPGHGAPDNQTGVPVDLLHATVSNEMMIPAHFVEHLQIPMNYGGRENGVKRESATGTIVADKIPLEVKFVDPLGEGHGVTDWIRLPTLIAPKGSGVVVSTTGTALEDHFFVGSAPGHPWLAVAKTYNAYIAAFEAYKSATTVH